MQWKLENVYYQMVEMLVAKMGKDMAKWYENDSEMSRNNSYIATRLTEI